jgi:23S rRNA (cytosine1962-C5)-methyltransferase
MAIVSLRSKIGHRVLNGHPWIFGNEIRDIKGDFVPGDTVEVETHDGKFVGKGYINPQSQIVVRLLTRKKTDEVNEDFFLERPILDKYLFLQLFHRVSLRES